MQNDLFKRSERGRAPLYLEFENLTTFKNHLILKAYYLSNSSLQSQARKCSCSHSLRLYMFRCLDTGLDNSHQYLKKKKDVVRIGDNKISTSTGKT